MPQKLIYNTEKYVGGSVSNVCGYILFKNKYSVDEVEFAVNELYRLNDSMRIQIISENGTVFQQISRYHFFKPMILNFTDKNELEAYCRKIAHEPMDLSKQLCLISIFTINSVTGIICKFHHLVCDAWTMSLVGTQISSLLCGESPEAYSYKDYCIDEQKYISGEQFNCDRQYFIEQYKRISDTVFISDISNDTFNSERISFTMAKDLTEKVKDYASKNQVSLFSVMLTVFSAYFSRIKTNCKKFYIGVPIINRAGNAYRNTMGMFINTVPMLIELKGDGSFRENLISICNDFFQLMRHQRFNYLDVMEDLRKNHGLNGRLYDVLISYQNAMFEGQKLESKWFENGKQIESLQIHFEDRDRNGSLSIHYDYQTEKFSSHDIEMLHNHLMLILNNIINDDSVLINEAEIMTPSEKQKVLCDFNATSRDFDRTATLYSLFDNYAKAHKDETCIIDDEKIITFGEFLNAAEKLDCKIRELTGNEKQVIGICADRCAELYLAIYAIIRGGNAYMPIDTSQPSERTAYMINNSDSHIIIGSGKYKDSFADSIFIKIESIHNIENYPETTLPIAAQANDTAYVIYTSGTTGNPKGAMISHRSAVNRINWMHKEYPLKNNDVILQKTPYTFDVSVWEIFWWGIFGGQLAFSKPGEHFLPSKITDEIKINKVTHIHFVPSVFSVFLDYIESNISRKEDLKSLRYIFLSGEALNASTVNRFYTLFKNTGISLHNLYGPTECAVDVTYYNCSGKYEAEIPIGKPIDNTAIYITDSFLNPVPIGVIGELCIAGENVGQGYINNTELTNTVFVTNPFGKGKMYKTGDLAYFRDDGNIIYIGRKDSQIKINGQRMEIGEIESILLSISGVSSAATIVKSGESRKYLVAFYCGEFLSDDYLAEKCSEKLPRYMIPSVFVHLESLPFNRNGKVDRKVLSTIETNEAFDFGNNFPINKAEADVCKSFSEILGINADRHTDFIRAGGSSINIISFISEKKYSSLSVDDFVSDPTPSGIAKKLMFGNISKFRYLSTIKTSDLSGQALIIFPFAGGTSASFAVLAEKVFSECGCSVFFANSVHTDDDCDGLAKEIAELSEIYDIVLYGHCVGTRLALKVALTAEKNGAVFKGIVSGGYIPVKSIGINLWDIAPEKVIKKILVKAGADFSSLTKENVQKIIRDFKADTHYINKCVLPPEKVKTPLRIIIADKDPFTKMLPNPKQRFSIYAKTIASVNAFSGNNHYFQTEKADIIVKSITSAFM